MKMKSLHRTGTVAFITAAGLLSALIISQGISCEKVSAQTQIVIPDPVAFFNAAEEDITYVPEDGDLVYCSFTDYDTQDMVIAYADLLMEEYGFEALIYDIEYNVKGDPDANTIGGMDIQLAYNGDPDEGEIQFFFGHNIGSSNGTAFNSTITDYTLVDTDSYYQGNGSISLPDPDTVLGLEGAWAKGDVPMSVEYRLDADAETAVSAYVSLLESDYGFQIINKEYDYESSEVADYVMTVDLAPEGDRTQGKITVIASSISDEEDYIYIYVSNLSGDVSLNWEDTAGTNSDDEGESSQEEDGEDKSLSISDIRDLLGD